MSSSVPVFEVEFDKHGNVFDSNQVQVALEAFSNEQVTDLLVFSHGWNNDMRDARELYQSFFQNVENILVTHHPSLERRKFAALAVLWPSKKFTDQQLIPSGDAASAEPDDLDPVLQEQLESLKIDPARLGEQTPADAAERTALERAAAQVTELDRDENAQREFVESLRSILPRAAAHPEDGSDEFFTRDAIELLQDLSKPVIAPPPTGHGGGALSVDPDMGTAGGEAAGIRDLWSGMKAGAQRLINFTTYYKMKERAGLVGKTGVARVVRQLHDSLPSAKIHLIGHSFGGRLVTAAADALGAQMPVNSLTLLQAAYSHNGLAQKFDGENDGFFRNVVAEKKVSGPILITHTKNDKAVGIAYPLASRISRERAAALIGDADDPYGGMGRNGAQFTPEADKEGVLREAGSSYIFQPGKIYNLNSDEIIQDHNDICKEEVAHVLLSAIAIT